MRMAIVHDWLDTWRGGETVLAEICLMYPDADLYALVDFLSDADREKLGGKVVHTSFVQRVPGSRRHFRALLPLFPRAIESLDVSKYDLVLSSSHAVAKGVRTRPDQLHICYCYTPMRYAWDLRDQYLAHTGLANGVRGAVTRHALTRLAAWDRTTSRRVTEFIAISQHVADRIQRCYDRTSTVIYPPVHLSSPRDAIRRDVYLTVSQLVPYKRVDLIAAAFAMLPERELVVIGDGPERERIQRVCAGNVRLLGRVTDDERDEWLARARAFIFAAEEDFGIAPLEAQGAGVPVIAFARGACLETIRGLDQPRPTGVFFDEQSVPSIVEAVGVFERNEERFSAQACRSNAARFSPGRFHAELRAFVDARTAEWSRGRGAR